MAEIIWENVPCKRGLAYPVAHAIHHARILLLPVFGARRRHEPGHLDLLVAPEGVPKVISVLAPVQIVIPNLCGFEASWNHSRLVLFNDIVFRYYQILRLIRLRSLLIVLLVWMVFFLSKHLLCR